MKKYILAVLACLLLSFISQQTEEAAIIYSTKVNMHKRIPEDRQEMKQMVPEYNITKNILLFNENESLYKSLPEEENPFDQTSGGNRIMVRTISPNETYLDRDKSMVTQLREFMGKKYLIKKEQNQIPWKLEQDTKEVQGFLCKSASFIDENEREIKAWYTEDIRVSLGPESYNGLPGLILEVAINDDDMVISAEKIDWRALKKNEIKVPKGGQEVSEEEYMAMIEEQMKSMGMQPQGSGGFRMIIRN
ncbi:GLPGLI family protein [Arthrospiribacter ruber]|uniref:GLPGLI family protein n=1 Tax=Arthrospiribacter ruber TaxID=2487934 RepID=A0A951MB75_9BACT|nr:GLPGLI family protein [Arthrospiribacter ruber]MBW3467049.1 GLPGLI family protein [Arthrospiribacter ruber]